MNRLELSGQVFLQAIVRDVTERKAAEKALRKERDMAQKYLDIAEVIFSRDQIEKILAVANRRVTESRNYFFARWAHYAIFSTIYACELRISECLKLKGKDIRRGDMTLFIRETKFGKNRIIPFHSKLLEVLAGMAASERKDLGHFHQQIGSLLPTKIQGTIEIAFHIAFKSFSGRPG